MTERLPLRHAPPFAANHLRTDLLALSAVTLAYTVVLAATRAPTVSGMAVLLARNLVPFAIVALAAQGAIRRWIIHLTGARAWSAHIALGAAFTLGWSWLLTVAAGLLDGASITQFAVRPLLLGPAAEGQIFQSLAFYLALTAWTMLDARGTAAYAGLVVIDNRAGIASDRFLVRDGDATAPLPACNIVAITGADDYAEVQLADGSRRLVTTTLAEFEAALDSARFLRVHRSAIVNLDRLRRADAAGGGCMLLHMEAGCRLR